MRSTIMLSSLAALMLASCGGSGADTDGDGVISREEAKAEVQSVSFKPGEWENTVEFVDIKFDESKMPPEAKQLMGPIMESMKGQTFTDKECMTEEQAKNPQEEFFNAQEGQECTYDTFSLAGGNIDMAMSCKGKDGTGGTIRAKGTYTATTYNMNMTIQSEGAQGGDVTISAKSTAKRVGECPS